MVDFQADLLATCFGNLLSAFVVLLGYLLFELWRDYIPIIFSAFLLSQSLSRRTRKALRAIERLRQPGSPSLLCSALLHA